MPETETIRTRSQEWAERAYQQVNGKVNYRDKKEYASFAKSFPALIHTCGLVQALAFADAKDRDDILEDLASVLGTRQEELLAESRQAGVVTYLRLSREALDAAGWIKRYVEALLDDKTRPGA